MKATKTPWFIDQVPLNPGVYETKLVYTIGDIDKTILFSKWDGYQWFDSRWTFEEAANEKLLSGGFKKHWCGLAIKP